jgi:hypothetical protein
MTKPVKELIADGFEAVQKGAKRIDLENDEYEIMAYLIPGSTPIIRIDVRQKAQKKP